jgi:hypothetical protein
VAAGISALEAAQERIKELNEELAAANQAATKPTGKSKPVAVDGTNREREMAKKMPIDKQMLTKLEAHSHLIA